MTKVMGLLLLDREEMREFSEQVQRDYIELIRLFPENRGKEQEIVQNHLSSEAID